MYQYKNLTIIGTSHISKQSIKEVEQTILSQKPKIVAIELDKGRAKALTSKKTRLRLKDIFKIGIKAFLLGWLGGLLQKSLGKRVGTSPGSEMKKAIKTAIKVKADLAFIDRDIIITLKRLTKQLTFKEKLRFFLETFFGFLFPKKLIKFDIKKVPPKKLIKELTNKIKEDYPTIYRILITERNQIMAQRLNRLMNIYKKDKIIAVVGAGHEEGIIKILKNETNKPSNQ